MSALYGRLRGNRGEATRCGSKASGIRATVETWQSVIRTYMADGGYATVDVLSKYGNRTGLEFMLCADRLVATADDPAVLEAMQGVVEAVGALNDATERAAGADR